jgi:polyhydroxybutyrate depolymerase
MAYSAHTKRNQIVPNCLAGDAARYSPNKEVMLGTVLEKARPISVGLAVFVLSCSSRESDSSGGSSTGGSSGGESGGTSAGGVAGSGGGPTGGSLGSGGSSAEGGNAGAATGAVAGLSSGGSASAGEAGRASGGNAGGGAASGAAGAGTSAAAGAGGAAGTGGASPTTGCGKSTWPASDRYTIDVSGTAREYILKIPAGYDPNRPYRLFFGWHWRGGSADNVAGGGGPGGGGYYGLDSRAAGSAIFVAPEGIDMGWANTGGRDIAFLRAMLTRLESELCIDQNRIFSTGFSYGGMMSLAVGCAMGDVFRAIAPMSGALYSGCENGDHPIAFWGSHGDADTVVPLENGRTGRDEFVERNHCQAQTTPTTPSPCVTYQGCDAGYPVTWCEFSGGHMQPSFSGQALWDFFSQF